MGSLLAGFSGLCAGLVAGCALSAFYVALGVFSKSQISLGLKNATRAVEIASAAGVLLGTAVTLFDLQLNIGAVCTVPFGLFGGIFVGIFIACLAEVVSTIPVLRNFGLCSSAIVIVLLTLAAGKLIGSLIYWLHGI